MPERTNEDRAADAARILEHAESVLQTHDSRETVLADLLTNAAHLLGLHVVERAMERARRHYQDEA